MESESPNAIQLSARLQRNLVSFQLLIGRNRLWLPNFITRYQLDNDRIRPALEKIEPIMIRTDRWFSGKQLTLFTRRPFTPIAARCCIALAVSAPPLELFPFASSAHLLTVALIGSALLIDDGRLMLCAALFSALSLFGTGFVVSKLDAL